MHFSPALNIENGTRAIFRTRFTVNEHFGPARNLCERNLGGNIDVVVRDVHLSSIGETHFSLDDFLGLFPTRKFSIGIENVKPSHAKNSSTDLSTSSVSSSISITSLQKLNHFACSSWNSLQHFFKGTMICNFLGFGETTDSRNPAHLSKSFSDHSLDRVQRTAHVCEWGASTVFEWLGRRDLSMCS